MKINAFGSQSWIAYYELTSYYKGLSVDSAEQYLYIAMRYASNILRVNTINGVIESYHG